MCFVFLLHKNLFSDKKWNFIDNPISIIITTLSTPTGSGFDSKNFFGHNNRQLIKVLNDDRYCLFYALGNFQKISKNVSFNLELSRLSHDQSEFNAIFKRGEVPPSNLMTAMQYQRLRNSKPKQKALAMQLLENVGIDPNLNEYGLDHVKLVQEFYDKQYPTMYRIVVMDDSPTNKPLLCGPLGRKYMVGLYFANNHFDGLRSIPAFFGHKKYCPGNFLK